MTLWRTLLAVGLVLGVIVSPVAQPSAPNEAALEGRYAVSGTNPDGAPYHGSVAEVASHHGAVYVLWRQQSGDDSVTGIGLLSGDRLAVAYKLRSQVTVVYRVVTRDRLEGEWVMEGAEGRGTERWERLP